MCLFFSSYIGHLVDEYTPQTQTLEMKEKNIRPGRIGTVFFCPEYSVKILKDKPPKWGVETAFGSNTASNRRS